MAENENQVHFEDPTGILNNYEILLDVRYEMGQDGIELMFLIFEDDGTDPVAEIEFENCLEIEAISANISVSLYNMLADLQGTIADALANAGEFSITWNRDHSMLNIFFRIGSSEFRALVEYDGDTKTFRQITLEE